jgi:hypothetical protein
VSLSAVGVADSGWVDIASTARASVIVSADAIGGAASAAALLGSTIAQFR